MNQPGVTTGTQIICLADDMPRASAPARRPASVPFLVQLIAEREQFDVQRRRRRAPVAEAHGAYLGRDTRMRSACDARI